MTAAHTTSPFMSLSPGTRWHDKLKLKSRSIALGWRQWWLKRGQANARVRARLREECAHDLLWYVNLFGWTYDPRTLGKSLPFMTYPFQDKAFLTILECVEQGEDLVIEKSRDMGASWMSLVTMEWLWHFHHGMSFLMVSRKENLVDAAGDPDSLFWKIDFVHRHLPEWLLPDRVDRRKLHFGNLDFDSTIDGESTTAAAGVGGRRTAVFIDEFSRIEEGYQLLAGTADTTRCRIFNFTPWGAAGASYKLAMRAHKGEVKCLRLHWSEHPEKARGLYRYSPGLGRVEPLDKDYRFPDSYAFVMDGKVRSPWYDAECVRRHNDREVAQMLDIDYAGSAYQFFDKAMILTLQNEYCAEPWWEGDIRYDLETAQPHKLEAFPGGPLKLWCRPDHEGQPPLAWYAAGADLASGTGATNSCLSLANRLTGEKVLEYASPYMTPEKMAPFCVAVCRLFKAPDGETTRFAWEQQGPGLIFGKRIVELGYRNIFYKTNEGKVYGGSDFEYPGWYPSNDNKRLLLDQYRTALSSREFLNRSRQALEECNMFVNTARGTVEHSQEGTGFSEATGEQDPSGARVNHGDRVIADALCWKMCRESGTGGPNARVKPKGPAEPPLLSLAWRRQYGENKRREQERD